MRDPFQSLKILIAPNAFKESLSSPEVAEHLRKGLAKVIPPDNLIVLPVADGGDGSLQVLEKVLGLRIEHMDTTDPLHRPVNASIGYSEDNQGYIEMAIASGLHLLDDGEKSAAFADSYGTGLLVKKAIENSVRSINLFVGGTASMDGGTGILRALGFRFLDKNANEVPPGGINLGEITDHEIPEPEYYERIRNISINIFCDVDNPLTGPRGSVEVFGPQKDAGTTDMDHLEKAFEKYADFLARVCNKDISMLPGGGAAGGVPAGLAAFLDVKIYPGAEKILEHCGFDSLLDRVDCVITGEGKLDDQSFDGKAPVIVSQKAREKGKKVIFVGGNIPSQQESFANDYFDAIFSIVPGPSTLAESMKNAAQWLERTGFQIAKILSF